MKGLTNEGEHSTSLQLMLFTILFFYKNCSKSVLVFKSKEVMKIIIRQIHQTGEVRHTLAGQFTRTLDILGRASALHCCKKAHFASTRSSLVNALFLGRGRA